MLRDAEYIDSSEMANIIPLKLKSAPLLSSFSTLFSLSVSEEVRAVSANNTLKTAGVQDAATFGMAYLFRLLLW